MEEIKAPKKERKFLKAVGNIAKVLANELVMGIARKFIGKAIDKVGNKRQGLIIAFVILASSFAFSQYPATGNKQRLGYQTSGDGLTFRGRASDTTALKPSTINNAYFILDTVNNILYNYIKTKGGWKFSNGDTIIIQGVTIPFDSITFNTAKDGTVITGEVEYNDTQGSLIQGLKGGLVTNVIGQQLHQRVNNRTGSTLAKGTAVYLSGSQGNRITVAKALGVTDAFSANTFGIVAESIANNQSGYVITEGLITGINTSALVEDSAVYLSPTVAGGLTSTKPQAPQHTVYIGVCVKSNAGSGELFVKIRNGQELDELHDVRITSPVNQASLYYLSSQGIWRDTTPTLLTSDTASMLTPYFKKSDTTSLNLTSRFAAKQNTLNGTGFVKASGTSITYDNSSYLRTGLADSTYLKLTGGTVTGNLTLTKGDGNQLFINGSDNDRKSEITFGTAGNQRWKIYSSTSTSYINFESIPQASALRGFRFLGSYDDVSTLGIVQDIKGNVGIKSNVDGGGEHPNTLYVNGTFATTGNGSIGGTLGVISTTTLTGALTVNNATVLNEGSGDFDTRIESDGNANMVFVDAGQNRVGIGTGTPSKTLDVNGEVKISTVSTPPTSLLGKDGSNVVGEVTDINQSGVMKVGSTTQNTSSVGIINVAHGLSYTPTKVIATIAQQSSYVIVCHGITSSNLNFTIYDSTDGTALNNVSVGFFWIAFK